MSDFEQNINDELAALGRSGDLRLLVAVPDGVVNFSSNDYLGIADDVELQREFFKTVDISSTFVMSNPSSRLMTGNNFYNEIEGLLAGIYRGKEALVLSSGYLVNIGVLPAVTNVGDVVIADKLVHASIIDGLRLCRCETARFRHNDLQHLELLLKKAQVKAGGKIIVVTESIFSMDGDMAPIAELVELKRRYDFQLYIDEAHAFGVYGEAGGGVAAALGLDSEVDYVVATFGKAIASQGAFVACSPVVRQWLINKMRTMIFSTALPPLSLMWSAFIIRQLPLMSDRRARLMSLCVAMKNRLQTDGEVTHIIPIIVGNATQTVELARGLRQEGYWVTAIRYPTVPKGSERLRISLTAGLNEQSINELIDHYEKTLACKE